MVQDGSDNLQESRPQFIVFVSGEVVLESLIGLDVGGTALKAVKLGGNNIVARMTLPAGGDISRDELARLIVECVGKFSGDGRPRGVGLCFGGLLQDDGTMRAGSTNLSIANRGAETLELFKLFPPQLL